MAAVISANSVTIVGSPEAIARTLAALGGGGGGATVGSLNAVELVALDGSVGEGELERIIARVVRAELAKAGIG